MTYMWNSTDGYLKFEAIPFGNVPKHRGASWNLIDTPWYSNKGGLVSFCPLVIKHGNGKSPNWMEVLIGKSLISGSFFQHAMCDYRRVTRLRMVPVEGPISASLEVILVWRTSSWPCWSRNPSRSLVFSLRARNLGTQAQNRRERHNIIW